MMIGEILDHPTARPSAVGKPVLEITGLAARDSRGIVRLKGIDLTVRSGEIVSDCRRCRQRTGRVGRRRDGPRPDRPGRIVLCGSDVTGLSLHERRSLGLSYLSPDRGNEGLCLTASISDNAIAGHHRRPEFCHGGVLKTGAVKQARDGPARSLFRHARLALVPRLEPFGR